MSDPGELLRIEGIRKTFPGVVALDGVDFELRRGEVHVLLGENGAGKSTLIKMLSGAYTPDAGRILAGGEEVRIHGARDSERLGIATIYQELDQDSVSTTAQSAAGVPVGNGRSNFNYVPERFRSEFQYYAATLDYDFGPVTLSSTTTYSDTERFERVDTSRIFGVLFPLLTGGAIAPGITPFDNRITLEKWTEEVRLTSASGGRLELVGQPRHDLADRPAQALRGLAAVDGGQHVVHPQVAELGVDHAHSHRRGVVDVVQELEPLGGRAFAGPQRRQRLPLLGGIPEDDHDAGNRSFGTAQRSGRVFDGQPCAGAGIHCLRWSTSSTACP